MILTMTQHAATPDQVSSGVVDWDSKTVVSMRKLLTFTSLPDMDKVMSAAVALVSLLRANYDYQKVDAVMIGGAPYLMPALVSQLQQAGYHPTFAYSDRVSIDTVKDDGSTHKAVVFKHMGFVD